MANLTDELLRITGYSYQIWDYQRGHSELTIRGTHAEKKGHNVHLTFLDVQYFQFPIGWEGDIYLASDNELIEIVKRTNYSDIVDKTPLEILKKMYSLFRVETSNGIIYILGKLVAIEYDIEPLYN